jgi:hypothetical protein
MLPKAAPPEAQVGKPDEGGGTPHRHTVVEMPAGLAAAAGYDRGG